MSAFNKNIQFRCKRCILPDNYPNIKFDQDGICNYCRNFEKKWSNYDFKKSEENLKSILEKLKKKKRKYDALVPISGGKDSTYVLYLCCKKYDMKALAFNYDNCWQSSYAKKNIENAINKLGVDFIQVRHNPKLMMNLYRGFLLNGAEVCLPCEMGFIGTAYKIAEQEKIPAIMFGHSEQTETLLPMEIHYVDSRYFADALPEDVCISEVKDFLFPSLLNMVRLMFFKGIKYIQLPQYLKWYEEEISNILMEELDWRQPHEDSKHFDCLFSPLREYIYYRKFGFGKELAKISVSVRKGKIIREEGLRRLKEIRDNVYDFDNTNEKEYALKILNLTKDDIDNLRQKSYEDFNTYAQILLRFKKILKLFSKFTHIIPENIAEKLSQ